MYLFQVIEDKMKNDLLKSLTAALIKTSAKLESSEYLILFARQELKKKNVKQNINVDIFF